MLRSALKLTAAEDGLLRTLYSEWGIPRDQFPKRPSDLSAFTDAWNALAERADKADEVLHYIHVQQKSGKKCKYGYWPTFDGNHQRLDKTFHTQFSQDEWDILDQLYLDFEIASDNFLFEPVIADRVAKEFARRSARFVSPMVLCAAIIAKRKHGELPTLRPKKGPDDIGFKDIDDVAV